MEFLRCDRENHCWLDCIPRGANWFPSGWPTLINGPVMGLWPRICPTSVPLSPASSPSWVLNSENIFYSGEGMKQNGSKFSKKENGLSQQILDKSSSFHLQWYNGHHLPFAIHLWSYFSKVCAFLNTWLSLEVKSTVVITTQPVNMTHILV